jgi:hypothetical protein
VRISRLSSHVFLCSINSSIGINTNKKEAFPVSFWPKIKKASAEAYE